MPNDKMTSAEGEQLSQGKFQGYVVAKMEDIGKDIAEIKGNDKDQWAAIQHLSEETVRAERVATDVEDLKTAEEKQWKAIKSAKVWNKIAAIFAGAAAFIAAVFGIGRHG